jgi:hypothetical protein
MCLRRVSSPSPPFVSFLGALELLDEVVDETVVEIFSSRMGPFAAIHSCGSGARVAMAGGDEVVVVDSWACSLFQWCCSLSKL